jgi:hypothetical protein
MQKGSNFQSEKTTSASKHDTEIIEELLLQHHVMSSIMQSRLTNMQVCVFLLCDIPFFRLSKASN